MDVLRELCARKSVILCRRRTCACWPPCVPVATVPALLCLCMCCAPACGACCAPACGRPPPAPPAALVLCVRPCRALSGLEGRAWSPRHLMYMYVYPTPHSLSRTALRSSFRAPGIRRPGEFSLQPAENLEEPLLFCSAGGGEIAVVLWQVDYKTTNTPAEQGGGPRGEMATCKDPICLSILYRTLPYFP